MCIKKRTMLSLKKEHKQHLSVLFPQTTQVLQDFCRLAYDCLKRGSNFKLCSTAAQKLGVTTEVIQQAVDGLLYLLVESQRHSVCHSMFHEVVLAVGFNSEQATVLTEFYNSSKDEITSTLHILAPTLPHYHDLEWRFEVQVASRALQSQVTPLITIKLMLKENHRTKTVLLQTDANNLKHMVEMFDQALQEASSQHMRRVQRTLK